MKPHMKWVAGLLAVAVGSWLFLVVSGVSVTTSAALIGVLAIQTWGGWAIWRALRVPGNVVETFGMAVAIGTALAALSAVAVRSAVDTSWGWIAPAVVGAILVVWRRRRGQVFEKVSPRVDHGVAAAVSFGAIAGVAGLLLVSMRNYPLTWEGMWGGYHGDMLFFEALGSSLVLVGPLDSIFSPDTVVRYHWLTSGWTGFLASSSGAEPFVTLTRALPLVALLAAVTLAASWTRRLTTARWTPTLAVALVLTGGYVGASYGTVLNFDSPSTALTTVWLMAAVLLMLLMLGGDAARTPSLVLMWLVVFATTAGKVSTGFLAVVVAVVLTAVSLLRRTSWSRGAVSLAAVSTVSAAAAYLLVVAGSADPGGLDLLSWVDRASSVQGLNPLPGLFGAALGTAILTVAVAARWAGVGWLWWDGQTRWSATSVAAAALALGGLLPLILLSGGVNETWFALSASAPLSVFSAAGLGRFVEQARPADPGRWLRRVAGMLVGVAGLWALLWVLWGTGPSGGNVWEHTLRWAGPPAMLVGAVLVGLLLSRKLRLVGAAFGFTILVLVLLAAPGRLLSLSPSAVGWQPGTRGELFSTTETFAQGRDQEFVFAWSSSENAAGRWLHDRSPANSLIATNHTFSPLVPALSGRQTLVSGMHYQAPYGWPDAIETLLGREEQSWNFIDAPSQTSWEPLCLAGVTHLWVDPRRTSSRNWEPWARLVSESPEVVLLEVSADSSTSCS